jgi:broad specificity phosphatase PhoE
MDKKIFLFLIRHGESEANVCSLYEHKDPDLTDKGLYQAQKTSSMIRKCFSGMRFKVFSSVLARAQETALILFPSHTVTVGHPLKEKGENVRERDLAIQHHKINTRLGHPPSALRYQPAILTGSHYTNEAVVHDGSIAEFLHTNRHHFRNGDIVFIVCHAGVMRCFMNRHETIPNCAVYHAYNTDDSMLSIDTLSQKKEVQSEMIYFPAVM